MMPCTERSAWECWIWHPSTAPARWLLTAVDSSAPVQQTSHPVFLCVTGTIYSCQFTLLSTCLLSRCVCAARHSFCWPAPMLRPCVLNPFGPRPAHTGDVISSLQASASWDGPHARCVDVPPMSQGTPAPPDCSSPQRERGNCQLRARQSTAEMGLAARPSCAVDGRLDAGAAARSGPMAVKHGQSKRSGAPRRGAMNN